VIEVEAKYRLDDPDRFESALLEKFKGQFLNEVEQRDIYYQHPARDFCESDEALRIRQCGGRAILCYKGPRLDSVTKTRAEYESEFEEPVEALTSILQALGFVACGSVRKRRRVFESSLFPGGSVAIDQVDGLGCFAEIEIVCEEAKREQATTALLQFAATLDLTESIRESYLQLLVTQGDRESSPDSDR